MNIILLGAPGAGKGTQATVIVERLGMVHIASGDLFRQAQSSGTELGNIAKSYMEKGELVPDEVTVKMILERIAGPDCLEGFVLDGFPRTIAQAEALEKVLDGKTGPIDKVIYIKVSEEELVQRLSGRWICRDCQAPFHIANMPPKVEGACDRCGGKLYQRQDDNEETVRNRIKIYLEQTAPLIEFYNNKGKLVEVDGARGSGDVGNDIIDTLEKALVNPMFQRNSTN